MKKRTIRFNEGWHGNSFMNFSSAWLVTYINDEQEIDSGRLHDARNQLALRSGIWDVESVTPEELLKVISEKTGEELQEIDWTRNGTR